ncbi:UNVERIFIED_CONTAM: hypothetical protein Slati_0229600 [Sesamum latifolium]|uniref:Retrotransposon gag domain-containing protein n=1 Tax=Sesamum latifolium TaxID=2727402 RepID=A0AAW2YC41_9LAMI
MVDDTRLKEVMEAQRKKELLLMEERAQRQASEQQIQTQLEGMHQSHAALVEGKWLIQQQLGDIIQQVQSYNKNKSVLGEGYMAHVEKSPSPQHQSQSFQNDSGSMGSQGQGFLIPKIEFPRFDGDGPRSSIRKCTRYFHIVHTIPDDQKVPLALVHFDGKAELWYQGLSKSRGMLTWPQFMQAVYERFNGNDPGTIVGIHKVAAASRHSREVHGKVQRVKITRHDL